MLLEDHKSGEVGAGRSAGPAAAPAGDRRRARPVDGRPAAVTVKTRAERVPRTNGQGPGRRPVLAPATCTVLAFGLLAFAVIAFSRPWAKGELVLDGPGVSLYLQLALEHLRSEGSVPYWMPEMWSGAPAWAIVPSFSTFSLLPLAAVLSPESAVRLATIAFQVAGAWGAFVLTRSLWGRRTPAPLVAGLLYGLHPLVISHGALFGHQPTIAVLAATPWLVWSLRRALRGDGPQHVAIAGLLVGFTLIEQAEHAYGLVVLCALLVVVQLVRTWAVGLGRLGPDGVMVRAAAVAAIGVGAVAYWLLPFVSLAKSFVLSPPDLVRDYLEQNPLSKEPGKFLRRAAEIVDPVYVSTDIVNGPFYLSWVCVILGVAGAVMVGRRDRERTLTAVIVASAIGVWMSTGAIALAETGPAARGQVLFFVAVGLTSGVLLGSFLRIFPIRRPAPVLVAATVMIIWVPYLTPFLAAQTWVPFLSSIRFPRLYPLAPLGLALAAAYPITLVQDWARRRRPPLALLLSSAVATAVVGIFVVDINPYRSYYRVQRAEESAYRQVSATLAATSPEYRVAADNHAIAEDVAALLDTGAQLAVGWPHPVAARDLWPLTVKALLGPVGYRDRALGLSSTAYVAKPAWSDPGEGPVVIEEVKLEESPSVLPLVRAYEQAVVVADSDIAPIMAVDLSHKNVVTITGGPETAAALGAVPAHIVAATDGCARPGDSGLAPEVAGQLAVACDLRSWMSSDAGRIGFGRAGSGATFSAELDRLQGISVRLDRLPESTQLVLRELEPDGRTLGREVVRTTASGVDENKLANFSFDPIPDSAGRRYAFLLYCPGCDDADEANLLFALPPPSTVGDLIVDGQLQPLVNAQYALRYDDMPPAARPTTTVNGERRGPGRWQVETAGQRPAVVVVAESYFPGWHARVDGEPAQVLKADGAFVGVPVPPGRHTIELEYRKPAAALVGRVVTALTLLAAFVLLTAGRRRRRRARHTRRPATARRPVAEAGASS